MTVLKDRPHLLSGGMDGTVRMWDLSAGQDVYSDSYAAAGQQATVLRGHTDAVSAMAATVLDDRPHVVSGSRNGTVRVWDLTTGQQTTVLRGHTGAVHAVAVTVLEGRPHVLSGGNDGTVRVWDLTTGQETAVLRGHTGAVHAVAVTVLEGRPHVLSGGNDGTVQVSDLTTGKQIAVLRGHTGAVWAVTVLDDRPHAVSGGSDGTVRVWDLSTPSYQVNSRLNIGNFTTDQQTVVLRGHTGRVLAVAVTVLEGRPHVVSGGMDGTVRVWDLTTGQQTAALHGHTDSVLAIAVTLLHGRPHAISGGMDGTVQVSDLTTGHETAVLRGHTGAVSALAETVLDDRPHAVSGGNDETVRVWDLTTGQETAVLRGHTGAVLAVAVTVVEGRPHVVSGGRDATVRVWDLTTAQEIEVLRGHTGTVWSIAAVTFEGRPHVVSGGDNGTVRVWDLGSRATLVGFPVEAQIVRAIAIHDSTPSQPTVLTGASDGLLRAWYLDALLTVSASGIDEIFAGENTGIDDRLGRGSLSAHLIERLYQLVHSSRSPSTDAGDLTGSGIVHIDGRWGAGKTTFIELMLRSWSPAHEQPLVVRYDAWRQAAIAPEWWSLASETRRAIHRSRAVPTRWVMTIGGFLRRFARSTSTWVALLAVGAIALVGRWLVAGPADLPQQLEAAAKLLTTITGVLAVAFVVSRNMFWSAPVLGRLHVRTDDNPLGEISGIVGHLRRWAPRPGVRQRLADWSITVWLVVTIVMSIWWQPIWDAWRAFSVPTRIAGIRGAAAAVLLTFAFLPQLRAVVLYSSKSRSSTTSRHTTAPPGEKLIEGAHFTQPRQQVRLLGIAFILIWAALMFWLVSPILHTGVRRLDLQPNNVPQLLWALAAVVGVAGYIFFLAAVAKRTRRMVLLIIDDLDRCDDSRVVRLLEAVHTVLRERAAPRHLARWRAPAPFGVLVVANGAWIRDAFRKHYETFERQSDTTSVHDLGADFLQKIFDHSILVPGLSPQQTEELVHVVAQSRYHRSTPAPAGMRKELEVEKELPLRADDDHDARDQLANLLDPGSAKTATNLSERTGAADQSPDRLTTNVLEPGVSEAETVSENHDTGDASDTSDFGVAAQSLQQPSSPSSIGATAARDDLGANARLLVNHLLTNYHSILPRNPRLIIRVATSWAMLRAVGRSLGLQIDAEPANEMLVRAAVIWVRFPVLVDAVLDADQPPAVDPTDPRCDATWRRHDVQHVLHLNNGNLLDVKDLARYYGKFFSDPEPPAPPAV